jgi:hypothetical protein
MRHLNDSDVENIFELALAGEIAVRHRARAAPGGRDSGDPIAGLQVSRLDERAIG